MSSIDRYAVIGEHIGHSRSPQIHAHVRPRHAPGHALRTASMCRPPALPAAVREFFKRRRPRTQRHRAAQAGGAAAGRYTDAARAPRRRGQHARARRDGKLLGDNTDGAGLVRDLTVNLRLHAARRPRAVARRRRRGARRHRTTARKRRRLAGDPQSPPGPRPQQLAQEFADLLPSARATCPLRAAADAGRLRKHAARAEC